jgi:hypothetical protein
MYYYTQFIFVIFCNFWRGLHKPMCSGLMMGLMQFAKGLIQAVNLGWLILLGALPLL